MMRTRSSPANLSWRRHQKVILLILTSVVIALIILRAVPREPRASLASPTSAARDRVTPPSFVSPQWPLTMERDPFAGDFNCAPTFDSEPSRGLRVQAILLAEPPRAIINGQSVREGDMVGTFRVHRITRRSVILERDGTYLELSL